MEPDAYRHYALESQSWLYRGRVQLLELLVREAASEATVDRLLEVGAGVGQNLSTLSRFGATDAAEIDPLGIARIRELGVAGRVYTERFPFEFASPYDVIVAMDVVEHLEDDVGALKWMASGLVPGGHLIVSVPAHQWLFSDHDRVLGHFRRYTKKSLLAALPADLGVVRAGYFNSLLLPVAVASRAVNGARKTVARRASAPTKQRAMMPGPIDKMFGGILHAEANVFARRPVVPFGLSVFALVRTPR